MPGCVSRWQDGVLWVIGPNKCSTRNAERGERALAEQKELEKGVRAREHAAQVIPRVSWFGTETQRTGADVL